MIIGSCQIHMTVEWVNNLKEKRMLVKSMIQKARNKFNISIAEVDMHDYHKTIVIGFTCISTAVSHVNSIIDNVINFIDNNTNVVVNDVSIEIL